MARRTVSRRGQSSGIVTTPLEEQYDVPYQVIGTPEWLDNAIEKGALTRAQKIYVRDDSDLRKPLDWLSKQTHDGVDSETAGEDKRSGLDPWRAGSRLLMLQIGTPELVLIFEPQLVPKYLREHLESENVTHILQHGIFDFKYLYHSFKIHMGRLFDTLLAEQALRAGRNGVRYGLADICRRYLPYRIINKDTRKEFIEFRGKFTTRHFYYAARDVELLFPIWEAQVKELTELKMWDFVQDEFDIIPATAMMELGGVNLDAKTLRLALTYWESRALELETEIFACYNEARQKQGTQEHYLVPGFHEVFDLESNQQKLGALRKLGFDLDNVQRDTLESIDHPVAALLAEYSNVMKIRSTYGENMLKRVNPQTGRFHPVFTQMGAGDISDRVGRETKENIATGRYSSDFQQLPKAAKRFSRVLDSQELDLVKRHFHDQLQSILQSTRKQEVLTHA